MPTTYTPILQLALPATGELNGTWGTTVNDNITSMVEQAIAGLATVNTWTTASHTLTTANGTTSEARCAILECSGAPGAAATVICPTSTKLYVIKNSVTGGYAVTLKTSAGTGISVPNGSTALLYCDGTNVVSGATYMATIVATSITDTGLTSGRVTYAGTGGLLQDAAAFTFDGTILSATRFAGALNGTVGATTASTGAFTTLSGTGQLTLTNASNYNLYASGAGANYMAGSLGIGGLPAAGFILSVAKNVTGATTSYGVYNSGQIQSDVTSSYYNFYSQLYTATAAFTLGNYYHYRTVQGPIGAGSAVTNQFGFSVDSGLTGATNNYGFYSDIASGTGRFNFYANGTAANYFAGNVGIGTSSPSAKLAVVGTGYSPNITLTDAATVAWDTSTGQVATFTFVSSNRTMGAPTNLVNGGFYALAVIQNAGSNTLTWNAVFKWAGGTAPTLSTAAGAKDYFVFRSDGTNLYQQGISQAVA